jgi:hypothetical protein
MDALILTLKAKTNQWQGFGLVFTGAAAVDGWSGALGL